ncbi:MAG: septal ring lytic transglycosylase RlpA family protein, partial [Thermodesulfobacteriota bacterium]|nr:septal ring lytic transglycosylase RlpA family protein [Thermodesulfobacteriota bacterium]
RSRSRIVLNALKIRGKGHGRQKQPVSNSKSRVATYVLCRRSPAIIFIVSLAWCVPGCGIPLTTYRLAKGTVKTSYAVTKGAAKAAVGTGKVVHRVGRFSFHVAAAPLSWPLTHEGIESIDGLSPKEAIRQGRVKNAPYVVYGRRYVPLSVREAKTYQERGMASWYGYETLKKEGGHMTANGERFDPKGLSAAHKHLPLPTYVQVTNLENGRSIIVRVNDRGPFVKGRIIDLSAGAARKLGFYDKGTARVDVETVDLET